MTRCALAVLGVLLLLAGCGKKPADVDPPATIEVDRFPRTYPNARDEPPGTYRPPGR